MSSVSASGRREWVLTAESELRVELGEADALFLVRDRAEPLVVLPAERWLELVKAARTRPKLFP